LLPQPSKAIVKFIYYSQEGDDCGIHWPGWAKLQQGQHFRTDQSSEILLRNRPLKHQSQIAANWAMSEDVRVKSGCYRGWLLRFQSENKKAARSWKSAAQ
jgi:hypothetical protein